MGYYEEIVHGEPNNLFPIYDNKMVKYLQDLGFKVDHVEVYVDNGKQKVTFFKYQRGFYCGIQKYMNWRDKTNRKKDNNSKC